MSDPDQIERPTSADGKMQPGEHLVLRALAFVPDDAPEKPEVAVQGSKTATTKAYVFKYSFDILVAPDLTETADLHIHGQRVAIYPPFRSQPERKAFVTIIDVKTLPYRQKTSSPDSGLPAPVEVTAQPEDYELRKDSLRIDCPADLSYEFAAGIADKLVELVRAYTNQWWIKRGKDHPLRHIRHWFDANELGERLGGVGTFAFFYGKLGIERTLDREIWQRVLNGLANRTTIPLSWDIFLDAIHFHAADDLRRCILDLGISNELLLAETLAKWAPMRKVDQTKVNQVLGGNDYLRHLSRAGKLWNRSFEEEYPTEFEWIKAIWIARGKLAHGKPPIAHGPRVITLKDGPSMFASVIELRKWLESI